MSSAPVKSFDQTANVRLAEVNNPSSKVLRLPASEPLRLACDQLLAPISIAYQTYGTLNCGQIERDPRLPCAHRRSVCRQRASGDQEARLVGDARRPRQAGRHRPLLRHLRQHPRRLHGLDGARLDRPAHGQTLRPQFSGHHHRRHGECAGAPHRSPRHRPAVLRHRRLDGRHAGAGMGVEPSRARVLARCRSRPPPGIPRRTSPSTRSGARPSWPIPTGAAATTIRTARSRATGSPSRAWPRTSPTCRRRRCTASSAAACRSARASPSRSTPTSRWRATCATRARPSSTASTPTATSTSRARWTISISRPSTATCWRTPSAAPRRASASSPSRATGSTRRARAARSCTR